MLPVNFRKKAIVPKDSDKDGTTYTTKNQVEGMLIDPKLPVRFDRTPNEERSASDTKCVALSVHRHENR